MKMVVTGASGLVGRSLVNLETEHELVGLTRDALDVTDREAVKRAFSRMRPDAILHCAGYTDVDGAEREPARAHRVNADGTGYVADGAREAGAFLVYVSTDYVFDGAKRTPYTEDDPPRPLSRYGESKLEGERRVTELLPDAHLIVRSAWLYGRGKGFPDFVRRRLEAGGDLAFVANQIGSPTWAVTLAQAIFALLGRGARGLFHFVNPGETSWLGMAEAVCESTGHSGARLSSLRLEDLGRPALRPPYSALAVSRFERATGRKAIAWRDALKAYLQGEASCAY